MRKLMTTVMGVAALCGMTALAQTPPSTPPTSGPTTGGNPEGRMRQGSGDREMEVIHHAISEAARTSDSTTLQLLTRALTDRTTLLNSEINVTAQAPLRAA